MRHLLTVALLSLLLTPTARAAGDALKPLAFPATAPGRHAQAWFAAYATGDDAVRTFWREHASEVALAQRPIDQRMQFLQQVRGDMGALTPLRIVESSKDACQVLARAEKGGGLLVTFMCAPDPEKTLAGMRFEPSEAASEPPGKGQKERGVRAGGPRAPEPEEAPGPPPTDAQIASAISSQTDSLARAGQFSGAVLLDKGGATLFSNTAGLASRAAGTANTLETRFNLGSLNKVFTHVAILQLAQAGKLGLDDTLGHWLPDYAVANGGRITLNMLLEHKGGVPDMLQSPELEKNPDRVRTQADWYALVREMPLRFEPGSRQQYSNGGFVLLGEVIARASGEDYYDYIRKHVYGPAGMTRSDHYAKDEPVDARAIGYTLGGGPTDPGARAASAGGPEPNTSFLPGRGSPAGGGYSTVGDLLRFANALRTGKLLDKAQTEELIGENASLGLAGGSPGVNALFMMEGPYTLVVMANLDPPASESFIPIGRMMRRASGNLAPQRR